MKLPDHVGLMWRLPGELIQKKNAIYKEAGIETLLVEYRTKSPRCRAKSRSSWSALRSLASAAWR